MKFLNKISCPGESVLIFSTMSKVVQLLKLANIYD